MTKAEKQKQLVKLAKENLGKPYKYGAKPEETPKIFDCSSFVQYLYKQINIDLPRSSIHQVVKGKKINKGDKLEIGDLIFTKGETPHRNLRFPNGIGHVVIYIGDDRVICAKFKYGKVIEEPLRNYVDNNDFRIIKRIL